MPKYLTNADKQKAYRNRKKELGIKTDGRNRLDSLFEHQAIHGKSKKKFNHITRRFCAFDTEGITLPDGKHICVLLSDNENRYIEDYKGLSTEKCFDFLLDTPKERINVGYSFNYDVNMMLMDCDDKGLERLIKIGRSRFNINGKRYLVEWCPSKSFRVALLNDEFKTIKSFTLYDVFGFFQKAFVKTALEFDVVSDEEKKFLSEMKLNRSVFKEKDKEEIRNYNALECRVLVRIMNTLRDAMNIADCVPTRWHGAGAIAGELMKRNGIKDQNFQPDDMLPIWLGGYFGGRIQLFQAGEHHNVWQQDIVSAYPSGMIQLPTSRGVWKHCKGYKEKERWAIYHVKWKIKKGALIAPFPFRDSQGFINYPMKGEGLYWQPEVAAALKAYPNQIEVIEGWYLKPETPANVFDWIKELFAKRKEFKASKDAKIRFAQLVIKLGINSLYGKCAQGVGYRGTQPPYQNYFWAGWITSYTRAKMFELAMTAPQDIIAFSTDGVFSKKPLAENSNELGQWEVDRRNYLFILKAGVYVYGKSDDVRCYDPKEHKGCSHEGMKTRGHSLREIKFDEVQKQWRDKGVFGQIQYKATRFVGLRAAMQAKDFRKKWARWIEAPRTINFMPSNQIPEKDKGESIRFTSFECSGWSVSYTPKGDWFEGEAGLDYLSDLDQPSYLVDEM